MKKQLSTEKILRFLKKKSEKLGSNLQKRE